MDLLFEDLQAVRLCMAARCFPIAFAVLTGSSLPTYVLYTELLLSAATLDIIIILPAQSP
jgi:uncharacterized membrane protein